MHQGLFGSSEVGWVNRTVGQSVVSVGHLMGGSVGCWVISWVSRLVDQCPWVGCKIAILMFFFLILLFS